MKIKDTEIKIVTSPVGSLEVDMIANASQSGKDDIAIRKAYRNALESACKKGVSSLAIPDLASGIAGFPIIGSAKILSQEIFNCLRRDGISLRNIIICLDNHETFKVFDQVMRGYLTRLLDPFSKFYATVDAIIEYGDGIIVIERSNPPYGWALPGGFADYGESLEEAVSRETKEETNLELVNCRQFHTYSDPARDPRFHTITTAFVAQGKGEARCGDDAKSLKIVKFEDLGKLNYAFDHKTIIEDYLKTKGGSCHARH